MPRYFIEVQYDGTAFHGSQIQGEQPTVQLALNKALGTIFRRDMETFGASRTDESVHALSNFYHVDIEEELSARVIYNLNALLPSAMAIRGIYRVEENANARFDAVSRQYRYRICFKKNPFLQNRAYLFPYTIREELLSETAAVLFEHTQFESFSKRNTQSRTFNCTIYDAYWERQPEELHFVIRGNRFLRGMVRAIVGTQLRLVRKGQGAQAFSDIIKARNCTLADFSVPGFGLYLEQINYAEGVLQPLSFL